MILKNIKRGDVFYVDLPKIKGHLQHGERPCLVVSNNLGNYASPNVIVIPLTTVIKKVNLPTHIRLKDCTFLKGSTKDGLILCETIITIDKQYVLNKIGHLDTKSMKKVEKAILISLGIGEALHE